MEIDWMPSGYGKVLHAVRRDAGNRNSLCYQMCTMVPKDSTEYTSRVAKCRRCLAKVAKIVETTELLETGKPRAKKRKGKV